MGVPVGYPYRAARALRWQRRVALRRGRWGRRYDTCRPWACRPRPGHSRGPVGTISDRAPVRVARNGRHLDNHGRLDPGAGTLGPAHLRRDGCPHLGNHGRDGPRRHGELPAHGRPRPERHPLVRGYDPDERRDSLDRAPGEPVRRTDHEATRGWPRVGGRVHLARRRSALPPARAVEGRGGDRPQGTRRHDDSRPHAAEPPPEGSTLARYRPVRRCRAAVGAVVGVVLRPPGRAPGPRERSRERVRALAGAVRCAAPGRVRRRGTYLDGPRQHATPERDPARHIAPRRRHSDAHQRREGRPRRRPTPRRDAGAREHVRHRGGRLRRDQAALGAARAHQVGNDMVGVLGWPDRQLPRQRGRVPSPDRVHGQRPVLGRCGCEDQRGTGRERRQRASDSARPRHQPGVRDSLEPVRVASDPLRRNIERPGRPQDGAAAPAQSVRGPVPVHPDRPSGRRSDEAIRRRRHGRR